LVNDLTITSNQRDKYIKDLSDLQTQYSALVVTLENSEADLAKVSKTLDDLNNSLTNLQESYEKLKKDVVSLVIQNKLLVVGCFIGAGALIVAIVETILIVTRGLK
jgi:chromosome segregation ATPase